MIVRSPLGPALLPVPGRQTHDLAQASGGLHHVIYGLTQGQVAGKIVKISPNILCLLKLKLPKVVHVFLYGRQWREGQVTH